MKMKTIQKILLAVALCAVGFSAHAQRGFDYFSVPRTLNLVSSPNIVAGGVLTNQGADIHTFDGIAKIDIFVMTNTGATGGTISFLPQVSNDNSNWSTANSFAFINTNTQVIYTNNYYAGGTNAFSVTNNYLLPGTAVFPTASSSGWATPYLNPATVPFTNNAAVSLPLGWSEIGFSIGDYPRYLRVVWVPGGTVTNFTGGAVLTGAASYNGYPF